MQELTCGPSTAFGKCSPGEFPLPLWKREAMKFPFFTRTQLPFLFCFREFLWAERTCIL